MDRKKKEVKNIPDSQKPKEIELKYKHDLELKILINEYNLCNERIESFLTRQDSILQISMAILGGAIAFTMVNVIPEEFYIAIPLISIILFTHIMYHYNRVIANQGYRKYLQNILNQYLPSLNQIKYSNVAMEYLLDKNPMAKINTIVFPSIIFFTIIFSIIMSNFSVIVILVDLFLTFIIAIIAYIYFDFTKDLDEKVKEYCNKV